MIIGVEENPQLQPAQCSFLGFGKGPAKKFLRVVNPDSNTDTLLISDICFDEWAKVMGYSPIEDGERLLKQLKEEADGLYPTINSMLDGLSSLRGQLSGLENLEARIDRLTQQLEAINSATNTEPEPGDAPAPAVPEPIKPTEPTVKPVTKP